MCVLVTECIVFISASTVWCKNITTNIFSALLQNRIDKHLCEGNIEIDSFRSNYGAFDFDKFAMMEWVKSLCHYDNNFIYLEYKMRRHGHSTETCCLRLKTMFYCAILQSKLIDWSHALQTTLTIFQLESLNHHWILVSSYLFDKSKSTIYQF